MTFLPTELRFHIRTIVAPGALENASVPFSFPALQFQTNLLNDNFQDSIQGGFLFPDPYDQNCGPNILAPTQPIIQRLESHEISGHRPERESYPPSSDSCEFGSRCPKQLGG